MSPGEFIPIVERTALARPTTEWVLEVALRQLSEWRREGLDVQLSINVSAANLEESDFAQRVEAGLWAQGLRPDMIELEITESAVMGQDGRAMALLQDLRSAGIPLAIDDFGTGYSSLAYLQRLPVRVVKIDQSFIRGLGQDEREQSLVRSMVTLTHDLGFRVVAEGVETAEAARILVGMGCEEAQGYHFARAMDGHACQDWWARATQGLMPTTSVA